MITVLPFRFFIAIIFLFALLYARSTGALQPLFLFPAIILAGAAVCYLWKIGIQTSLLSYAAHAGVLGLIWAFYLLYRADLVQTLPPATANSVAIVLYICLAFSTLFLVWRLCRYIPSARKWGAALLALYPVSMIVVTLAVKDTETQQSHNSYFGAVVEKIEFRGIAPLPYEAYRYHALTRTVSIPPLKLKSIFLRVANGTPDTALLEVIEKTGRVRYAMPRVVHFDAATLVSEPSDDPIDGQLVITSNDSRPYDWDVFYQPVTR